MVSNNTGEDEHFHSSNICLRIRKFLVLYEYTTPGTDSSTSKSIF